MGQISSVSTALAAACFIVAPASAATLILGGGGPNYAQTVHNDHAASGSTVTLRTKEAGYFVDYIAPGGTLLDPGGNGNGFAKVNGPFASLTIDPQGSLGFTSIGFTLDPVKIGKVAIPNPNRPGRTIRVDPVLSFDILVTYADGGAQLFNTGFAPNGKFDILAAPDEVISSVAFSNLVGKAGPATYASKFETIRQVSFNASYAAPPIPEPATWAMMIAGFGVVGAALRLRRRSLAAG